MYTEATVGETGAAKAAVATALQPAEAALQDIDNALQALLTALPTARATDKKAVTELFERRFADVRKIVKAFEEPSMPASQNIAWAGGKTIITLWSGVIAFLGEEKGVAPRTAAGIVRNLEQLFGDFRSATITNARHWQTFRDRLLIALLGFIIYTAAIVAPQFHGTKLYNGLNISTGFLVAALLIFVPEWQNHQEGVQERKLPALRNGRSAADLGDELARKFEEFGDSAAALAAIKETISPIVERFKGNVSKDAASVFASLNEVIRKVLADVDKVSKTNPSSAQAANRERGQKTMVLSLGMMIVVVQILSSIGQPYMLGDNLRWAAYYIYLLGRSVLNPSHTTSDTSDIFCVLGSGPLLSIPTVSAPLLIGGNNVFDNMPLFISSIVATTVLGTTVAHHVAPAGVYALNKVFELHLLDKALKLYNALIDLVSGRAPTITRDNLIALRNIVLDRQAYATAIGVPQPDAAGLVQRSSAFVESVEEELETGWDILAEHFNGEFIKVAGGIADDEENVELAYKE